MQYQHGVAPLVRDADEQTVLKTIAVYRHASDWQRNLARVPKLPEHYGSVPPPAREGGWQTRLRAPQTLSRRRGAARLPGVDGVRDPTRGLAHPGLRAVALVLEKRLPCLVHLDPLGTEHAIGG